jgi:hypothetical protein
MLQMSNKRGTPNRPGGERPEPKRPIAERELPLDHHVEEILATLSVWRADLKLGNAHRHSPNAKKDLKRT